jgi:hypothetical protein
MDAKFFSSLYEGDSPNGVKLGMGLTGGDFWPRPNGCQNLYRGPDLSGEAIDFENILASAGISQTQITAPSWLPHLPSTTHFYLVRRANGCGQEEHTLGAAEIIVIDETGELAEPRCNNVFSVKACQIDGDRVELVWFYHSIGQKAAPARFEIHSDNGSGQIDYENAVAQMDYTGRRFYSWQSETLPAEKYLFCIKAFTAEDESDGSPGRVEIHLDRTKPGAIEILQAEVV